MITRLRKRSRRLGTLAWACSLFLVAPLAAHAGDPPLPPASCPAPPAEALYVVKSGDVDNDTRADIYLENASVSQIIDLPYDIPFQVDSTSLLPSLLLQDNGSGGYTLVVAPDPQTLAGVTWEPARHALREGDFDGDGTTDLFVWAQYTGERSVLLHDVQIGETPTLAQVVAGAALGSELSQQGGKTVCAVDLNLNGRDDLLVDGGASSQASYTSTAGLLTTLVPYPPCTVGGERDSDCDGVADRDDAFPYDPSENQDTDGDGVGNLADLDDDNDGIVDGSDQHPLDENNGLAVGATAASFDVSSVGKARYRIPIRAVPSVGGVAPEISLAYAGEAGNGLLGMGFYIDGLSQITRCPTTLDQDGYINAVNFDSSDRFCLNGERLVAVEGAYGANNTEYRTERESHARIVSLGSSGNGPQQFVVEQRGGLIETYGGTTSSRREAQASADVVTWAVSSVRDREGNTATFTYHNNKAQGDFRIERIDYTANATAGLSASNSIRFDYESRTDIELSHADSTLTRIAHRMTSIAGYLGASNKIFEYQLAYAYDGVPTSDYDGVGGRSRLKSVTECVDDVGCLTPTVFQWDVVAASNFGGAIDQSFNEVSALTESQYVIGDVNGDGRNDLVWTYRLNHRLTRAVYLANAAGDGFTATGATQSATEAHDTDYFAGDADAQKFLMMDVDGDGKDDLVWVAVDGAHLYRVIYRARADGMGFDEQGYELDHDASYVAMTDHRFEKADVNGDGRDDLVWVFRSGHRIGMGVYWGSVGAGGEPSLAKVSFAYDTDYFAGTFELQQFAIGDVNGDGKSDLVWTFVLNAKLFRVLYLANTAGSGFMKISLGVDATIFPSIDLYSDQEALLGDVNNDGKDDLVWTFSYNDQVGRVLYLATPLGTSFSPAGGAQLTSVATGNHVTPKSRLVDVDRDGRLDIVYNYVDSSNAHFGWVVFHPNATFDGFVEGENDSFGIGGNQQDYAYQYADVTGDGAGDLVWTYRTSTLAQHRVLLAQQSPSPDPMYPDHLDAVTDGLGKVVDFDYGYLVGSTFYTPGTGSTYPVRESPGLGFVVKHLEVSDGIGGERAFDYAYVGARTHLRGRGYLGFEERRVTDVQSGFVTTERYRQDYPFIGALKSKVVRTGGATPTAVSKTFSHWDQDPVPYLNGSTPVSTVFPFERESISISYEPNDGGSKSAVLRESVYSPTFGNLLQTSETVGIDFTGPIDGTFDPDGDYTASQVSGRELTVTTVNDYRDTSPADTDTNWRFAFLESTTTTTDLEDNSEPNRVVTHTFTPYSATSFLTQTETRFAGTTVELTRTFDRDSYGNVTQTVVTGDDIDGGSIAPQTTTATGFAANLGLYPAQTTSALGSTTYVYDQRLGTVSKSTDPNGEVSETVRDGFGRVVLERAFDGTETRHRYRECGIANPCPPRGAYLVITTVTHPARPGALGAPTINRYFDLLEREIRTDTLAFDGGLSRIDRVYDARGRMSSETEPHFSGAGTIYGTTYLYDDLDRVTGVSLPSGGSVTKVYESDDVYAAYERTEETITSTIGAPRTAITHRWFDARGNVVVTTDPAGQTTATSYDGQGNRRTTRINGNSATDVVRMTDVAGNPVSIQDPDAGSLALAHDALGRLRRQVHGPAGAQQATEVTTYDVLDRIVTRTDSLGGSAVGMATWSYKTAAPGRGMVESVSQTNYLRTYQYDHHSRLASTTTTLTGLQAPQTFQYGYDAFSRPHVTTYPNGFEAHTAYSTRGYAATVGDGKKAFWRADAMDARGKVSQETLGNGLQSTRVFDPATGNLQTLQTGPSGSVQNLSYIYDSGRNLVRRQSSRGGQVVTETLTYDTASRLLTASTTGLPGGNRNLVYEYDGLGNLKTQTGVSNANGYAYPASGAIHAVTSVTLGSVVTSYGYDVRGNMTTSGARTIGYAPFDQVTSITEGSELATEFRYGPDRERYYQSTDSDGRLTKTAYYEGGLYEIVEEDGEIRRKAYVGDILVHVESVVSGSTTGGTKRIYLHHDHLGSVETVTDGAGAVVAHSAFAPYGARRADDWADATPADAAALPDRTLATTTRGFTDHEHLDASQLVHMGGRVYDPIIGRFLSPDPVVVTPDLSQGYNRYSYVLGNPLTLKDPTGMAPILGEDGSGDRRRVRFQDIAPSSAPPTQQLGGSPRPNAADGEMGASQSHGEWFDGKFGLGVTVGVDVVAGRDFGDRREYGTSKPVTNVGGAVSADLAAMAFFEGPKPSSVAAVFNYGAFARYGNSQISTSPWSAQYDEAHGAYMGVGINAVFTTANDARALSESLAATGSARASLGPYGGSAVWGVTENGDFTLNASVTPMPSWGLGISWGVSPTSTKIIVEKEFR